MGEEKEDENNIEKGDVQSISTVDQSDNNEIESSETYSFNIC